MCLFFCQVSQYDPDLVDLKQLMSASSFKAAQPARDINYTTIYIYIYTIYYILYIYIYIYIVVYRSGVFRAIASLGPKYTTSVSNLF